MAGIDYISEGGSMTIGYLGLGNMGGALARRLQLSHQITVYDRDPRAVDALVAEGAIAATSPQELASACDIVFLCLPTSDHVEDALFGEGGLATRLAPGSVVIDQTTGDPTATRALAARLTAQGISMIDAPVSGGVSGAAAGTISIMVGASVELLDRIRPVLESISPNIFHAGDIGTGHAIKLVNNLISGTQRILTLEALSLAAKAGIDPTVAVSILKTGGARNSYMENVLERHILEGNLVLNFTLGLAHKDIRLACQLAIDSEVPLFYGNLTRELLQSYISEMGRDSQVDTAALVIDRLAKTHVVPEDHTS